jgi:hypothetical protein
MFIIIIIIISSSSSSRSVFLNKARANAWTGHKG